MVTPLITLKVKRDFCCCCCWCRYWIGLFATAQSVKSAPLSAAATLNRQGMRGVSTGVRRLIRIPQMRFPVLIPAVLSKVFIKFTSVCSDKCYNNVLRDRIRHLPAAYVIHGRPTKSTSNCENVRRDVTFFLLLKCWLIQSLLLQIGMSGLRPSFLWSCPSSACGIF